MTSEAVDVPASVALAVAMELTLAFEFRAHPVITTSIHFGGADFRTPVIAVHLTHPINQVDAVATLGALDVALPEHQEFSWAATGVHPSGAAVKVSW